MFNIFKKRNTFRPFSGPPPSGMDKDTVIKKINEVEYWWHHIEVGYGIVTPGHQGGKNNPQGSKQVLEMLNLPENLEGKTVLDVGAWDGFFSFECERRGAKYVLAIDKPAWSQDDYRDKKYVEKLYKDHFIEKEIDIIPGKYPSSGIKGFLTAREILASKVDYKILDVYEISPDTVGYFDIVLFLGILYHLRHPLLVLEQIASVTKEMIIVESHCIDKCRNIPIMQFYEKSELANDPSNWWGPNLACLEALIRSAGFSRTEVVCKKGSRAVVKGYKK